MTTLILYVFHEFNNRVDYFLKNAIFQDDKVDFLIICNNTEITFDVPEYVKVLKRNNIGYDFGGWSDGLFHDELYKKYDSFIFVNSSVLGPFIPSYFLGKWTDIYLNGLKNNIKLFGTTINTCGDPLNKSHVQSYIYSMDRETLEYLIQCNIFSTNNYVTTFNDAIWQKEVLMSRKIIENGWNIGCLHKYYNDVDFTFKTKKPGEYKICFLGDIMFQQHYDSKFWNILQLVFIKGNRVKI